MLEQEIKIFYNCIETYRLSYLTREYLKTLLVMRLTNKRSLRHHLFTKQCSTTLIALGPLSNPFNRL